MYKGASQSLQYANAVDRPHPSKGYIDGPSDARDILPAPETLEPAQLAAEQRQLRLEMQKIEQELAVAKAVRNESAIAAIGQRKMVHQTRLSAVNAVAKERNKGRDAEILSQAIRDVCDEETRVAIFARARDLRETPASAIEARSDATGTGAAEGESATRQGDAQ